MTSDQQKEIEALYERHGERVGRYLLARLRDRELAEELTAQVFLTVVKRFQDCHSSPVGWLWSIARSLLAQHWRSLRVHEDLNEDLPSREATPSERLTTRDEGQRLWEAVRVLSPEQQELVRMKFLLEMSNVEIAEAIGMTRSRVGVALHRALKRLKRVMGTMDRDGRISPGSGKTATHAEGNQDVG